MKRQIIVDGNEACANASYLFSEICSIYPITPATPMATLTDKWSEEGRKNLFNDTVKVVEMQSEAGAAAMMHGSLQAGSLSTTFTASQGLLLMIPSMYKMSGELLPGVIHVAARSLATHALSIFGDHQDVYAARSTGFAFLSSNNVESSYYLALISHLSAIKGRVPFLHFFDGFRTSHEVNKISILEEEDVVPLVDFDAINEFRDRSLNTGKKITRGTSQTEDVYFQNTEVRNKFYMDLPDIVNSYMKSINEKAGTSYAPFVYYGHSEAESIIIAMGSVTDTIKLTVDELNKNGKRTGVIIVHLYRPFSEKYFLEALPKTVTKIAVLDRTKEPGSIGEPLYLDICNVLKENKNIEIVGGRYGLSSKDVNPSSINAVFKNLEVHNSKNPFTIGIIDDVTNLSLDDENIEISKKFTEIKVFGFGSDGMVSASKNLLKILGEKENFVQGYFEYDSKKSGGVTISHLRISKEKIYAPYYPEKPSVIVVTRENYLNKFDLLEGIVQNGAFLINSNKTDDEINKLLSNNNKNNIKTKNIKVFVCDTSELEIKYNLVGKINNIITLYVLRMLGHKDEEKLKQLINEAYIDKGKSVVENNVNALDEALKYLRVLDNNSLTITNETSENKTLNDEMLKRRGNMLKVSDFLNHEDGTYEGGTSKSDKRKISSKVPKWIKENCIECNQCAFVCPHAVIRPFSLTNNDLLNASLDKGETIASLGEEGKGFYISVSESNCTGCNLCVKTCPGKGGQNALELGEYNERLDKVSDYLFNEFENEVKFDKYTVKGAGFKSTGFEFPGACAGCGETGYLRLLTQLYKNEIVIANATGCSSIYGASLPCTPYEIPWINSLFEDNAEFGLGIHTSYENTRSRIKNIMIESKDIVEPEVKELFKEWIENKDNYEVTSKIKNSLEHKDIPNELRDLLEYIPSRKVWIVGGDGWAYDIGYGGLDHVLNSGENIKILILDSEVYSNTGGQKSKASREGAIAEFSSTGKLSPKKDLFRIAMCTPNVYVASISMGANMMQTLKVFKEANEHNGPAVIIAYSTCISHGIKGGMSNSLDEQKLLVESGYNLLMRYNPEEDKLTVDSKEPEFSRYEEVFSSELRYKNLENLNPKKQQDLFQKNLDSAKKRYEYYKSIEK